jgi:tetratricopeptide (TPR) repeat protein
MTRSRRCSVRSATSTDARTGERLRRNVARKTRKRISEQTAATGRRGSPSWSDEPWFWPCVIGALALVLRVLYVLQVRDTPFFQTLGLDARFYDRTAWAMLSGDSVEGAFFMSPLYSWFLAGLYRLFGRDLLLVRLVQSVLGAGVAVLVYQLGTRVFDRKTGVIAGLLAATYGAFIFYDGSVLMTPLLVFLSTAGLYLLVEADARGSAALAVLSGVAMGFSGIGRASALAFVPFAALWLFMADRWGKRRTASPGRSAAFLAALLLVGVVVVVAPLTFRNYVVSGDFVPITSNGGINFYIGNSEIATGGYEKPEELDIIADPDGEAIAEADVGRDLSPSEVSSYWFGRAGRFISANPGAWASLLVRKLAFVMSSYELPQLENYYFQRRYSWLLSAPLPGFAVVAPLGLVGLVLAWSRRRARILLAFFGVYVLTIVAFFVVSRYRLPAVPALIIGAAHALVWLYGVARRREWRRFAAPALCVGVLAFLVNANLYSIDREKGFAQSHYRLGIIYGEQGDVERAMSEYRQAIVLDPQYPKSYLNLGAVLAEQGRDDEAVEAFRRAIRLDPEYSDARINLAIVLERSGDYESALAQLDSVVAYEPGNARALKETGIALLRTGREGAAREVLERALAADDTGREEPEVRFYLGVLDGAASQVPPEAEALMSEAEGLIKQGHVQEALARLEEASRAAPTSGEPLRRMAAVRHDMGLLDEASELIERALRIDPMTTHGHFMLGVLSNDLGDHDRAVIEYEAELQINEGFAPAHLNLGLTYQYHLGNPNRALYHYRRYLELGGERRGEVEILIDSLAVPE